ncbi:hypothetical protein F1D05_02715 [Kribbella qitaiheensis]|uniref:Uncharacterized protein n=1 Tax=Kribbella qitaiheensis TaxID=1544730 RepID=A0A7G6WSQ5_9ACTN|nr:hypothetical protein F1D05_02715 [Kribbella qitaiheensis]
MGSVAGRPDGRRSEQALDLIAGERDRALGAGPVVGRGLVAAFAGGGDGEEGVGEQGQGRPSGARSPSADHQVLMAVGSPAVMATNAQS